MRTAVATKPFPPATLHAELAHESREIFARICLIFGTLGNNSVRNRAIWPLAGTDNGLLATTFPVLGSHNRANTNAVAVSGLAMAIPVFSTPSVSAAKSVADMTAEAGSTPISETSVGPEKESRRTVVNASHGEEVIVIQPEVIAPPILICISLLCRPSI